MKRVFAAIGASLTLLVIATPASAAGMKFQAALSGAQEVPEVATGASGKVLAKFDDALTQVEVKVSLNNIVGVTAAHFHCDRPGLNGVVAFGLIAPGACTLVNDQIQCTLTNADVQPFDCVPEIGRPVNNIAALAFAMRDGLIYFNVHTMANSTGELRGQMIGK
jgi:hypothetical protein